MPKQEIKVHGIICNPCHGAPGLFHKWRNLLGLLRSLKTAVAGAHGMFTRLHHALKQARGRWVHLSPAFQDELITWRQLVQELLAHPTHLIELNRSPPTWEGATDASGSGMGGVCQDPDGQWFVWSSLFSKKTQSRCVTDTNPKNDVTINDLELAILFAQVNIYPLKMDTLSQICTAMDNTAAQGWSKPRSVRLAAVVGHILWELALLTRMHKIYSSV